jgi:hypothetical protein
VKYVVLVVQKKKYKIQKKNHHNSYPNSDCPLLCLQEF